MANTRQIEPTLVWSPSGNSIATFLGLINFFDYHFDNGGGTVTYSLIGMKNNDDGIETAVDLYMSNINIPSSVVVTWGENDDVIFEYVAITLGLTIIQ